MQKRFRLTRTEDFKRVRRTGKSYAHPLVVLVAQNSGQSARTCARVGVSAGKPVGNAVQRNRAKRLLREAIRPRLESISPVWDLLLIARPAFANASLQEVCAALNGLLKRANILPDEP